MDLVARLEEHGAKVYRDGGLVVLEDRERVPMDLLNEIQARKGELLLELKEREEDYPVSPARLVRSLKKDGIELEVVGYNQIKAHGELTPKHRRLLRQHKDAIFTYLDSLPDGHRTDEQRLRHREMAEEVGMAWREIYGKLSSRERLEYECRVGILEACGCEWAAFAVAAYHFREESAS